jgi:hypothetical protein
LQLKKKNGKKRMDESKEASVKDYEFKLLSRVNRGEEFSVLQRRKESQP